jgi:hypothetical protein
MSEAYFSHAASHGRLPSSRSRQGARNEEVVEMASKAESLKLNSLSVSRPSPDPRRLMRAVAGWFRRGQLGGYESMELSRLTGGKC